MTKAKDEVVTVIAALPDGSRIVEHADGRLARCRGQTGGDKFDRVADAGHEATNADHPDSTSFKDLDWSDAVLVVPPRKQAISIRVDQDVLDFFKRQGAGYQRRINAVLRSYMQQVTAPRGGKVRK